MTQAFFFLMMLANLTLCGWRTVVTFRARRLLAIAWALLSYFSALAIPLSFEHQISWTRNFIDERVSALEPDIHLCLFYICAFSVAFFAAESILWRVIGRGSSPIRFHMAPDDPRLKGVKVLLACCWVLGTLWYLIDTRNMTYRDYVEAGGHWSVVFFWASSPLISILSMQGRWRWALALCIPFVYFGFHLEVRSFALLSIVPVCTVWVYQVIESADQRGAYLRRLLRNLLLALLALIGLSIAISQYKTGGFAPPDAGMPYGFVEVATSADKFHERVGFAGLELYGIHYIWPFMRLVGLSEPDITDTPVVIARLLDGVPDDWPVYFHYPATIWSDAYLSFGWNGLWTAVLWAAVLCLWDRLASINAPLAALVLPYLSWHDYLLVRGAIAVASVPLQYSFYVSLIIMLMCMGSSIRTRQAADAVDMTPKPRVRPSNLMS